MRVLFLGNSLLSSIYENYINDNSLLSNKHSYYFFLNIGGWGPVVKFIDKKISLTINDSNQKNFYYPNNIEQFPISFFDLIFIVSLGSIGCGLDKYTGKGVCEANQIFHFGPTYYNESLPMVSFDEFSGMFNDFMQVQNGVSLLDELAQFSAKKIVVEQPLHNIKLVNDSDWILNKIYNNPVEAYKYFTNLRRNFLMKKCTLLNYDFIPSLFKDEYFTPEEYLGNDDYFHPNNSYSSKLIDEFSKYF